MRALLVILLVWLVAPPALAQDDATLVADKVFLNADRTLTAKGAVEVLYQGARLTASRIVYDSATETLTIDGPIRLTEGGGTVILADQAQLSRDLSDGILKSARMVMRDQLQLAANELRRVGGRYTQLTRVVASSCQVCASNPRPLWEIRASRVVQDPVRQRLYFDDAQLRVLGLPVFYVPRLRLPEPGVERATGFLVPRLRSTTQLGTGILLPYFIAIGDSRDVTITPYVSTNSTRTVQLRYRQAFTTGRIEFSGALSRDSIRPGETRGYLFGGGTFILPRSFVLSFNIETVSDDSYLLDYDITSKDRLTSFVRLGRTRSDEHIAASLTQYDTIRTSETNALLPTTVGALSFERRFGVPGIGGIGGVRFEFHSLRRSSASIADIDGDGQSDGRDMARATAGLNWQRTATLPSGIVASAKADVDFDVYSIGDDPAYPGSIVRTFPSAAVELRWPLVRRGSGGATSVLEPVVQLVWSPDTTEDIPNEDSRLVEFDEANLFSLSRFPGSDANELGLRANIGVNWTRFDPSGWTLGLTAGRVIRAEDLGQFSAGSGLDGAQSDWLVAARFQNIQGFEVLNRTVFDDSLSFTKNELRLGYFRPRYDLAATYIWQIADPAESRDVATHELTLATGWTFADGWHGTVSTRYDFVADRTARAGLGIEFRNECAEFDLSLSRRFTSSTSVEPVTDFNFEVTLSGFGARGNGRSFRQSCGK